MFHFPIKSDQGGGGQNVKGTKFCQQFIITETACMLMLALKINYNLESTF